MTPQRHRRKHRPRSKTRADAIRIIPLGGLEEVGRNMTLIEYRGRILIVDIGLRFPEEGTPGIDYIIPNVSYLKERKERIEGIVITHAHYDHMGAIPYLMEALGNPPIYATPLARDIILKRQSDFPHAARLEIHTIKKEDRGVLRLGPFTVEYFHVNHNVPDSIGLAIKTPMGTVVHSCDFKFDYAPIGDKPADLARIAEIGSREVLVLLSDSTGAEHEGHSLSEKTIMENLEQIFKGAEGRIIASTFSSLLGRVQQIFLLAEKYQRRVALDGFSMKANVEIAQRLGHVKASKGLLVGINEVNRFDPKRSVILCTGAQGEGSAVLMRIANREHRFIRIQKNDTVIFSSSIVPGNERNVQYLKDSLLRQGAEVFHYRMMDIHASGHAYKEDLKLMLNLVRPKFLVPIHGHYSMLKAHADIGQGLGMPESNIAIAANGQVIEVTRNRIQLTKEQVSAGHVFVDGLGVGDVREVVLRDRQMMAADGIFVIIAVVDKKEGKVRGNPDIISRGFIYLRESQTLLDETRELVRKIIEEHARTQPVNWPFVRNNVREGLGKFLFEKTERRPMVIPVIIEA